MSLSVVERLRALTHRSPGPCAYVLQIRQDEAVALLAVVEAAKAARDGGGQASYVMLDEALDALFAPPENPTGVEG